MKDDSSPMERRRPLIKSSRERWKRESRSEGADIVEVLLERQHD